MSKPRRANPGATAFRPRAAAASPAGARLVRPRAPGESAHPGADEPQWASGGQLHSSPSPEEAAAAAAVRRLDNPLTTMLLWCTALRGSALPEICQLIGLTEIDVEAFSAEHRAQIQKLRALECFGELCSREVLGRLCRAALGQLLMQDEDPGLKIQALRLAPRQPQWVLEPELAQSERELKLQEVPVRREELRCRRVQATERRCEARLQLGFHGRGEYVDESWPLLTEPECDTSAPLSLRLGQHWASQVKKAGGAGE